MFSSGGLGTGRLRSRAGGLHKRRRRFDMLTLKLLLALHVVGTADGFMQGFFRSESEPHASECRICKRCTVRGHHTGGLEYTEVELQHPEWAKYLPEEDPNAGKPVCDECRGCTSIASPLVTTTQFKGYDLGTVGGHSSASIFRVSSPRAQNGYAIGKIWCTPFVGQTCSPEAEAYMRMTIQKIMAVDKVNQDCGFDKIVPRSWVENITTIIPGLGFVYQGEALMMEVADGVSVKELSHLPAEMQEEVVTSLDKSELLLAGLFDTLLEHRDRNDGNAFVSEANQLRLIDNDKVLGGVVNSIFVPNTAYFHYNLFGREYVRYNGYNTSQAPTPRTPKAMLGLDYRCAAPDGILGKQYPPAVEKCLVSISSATPQEVHDRYGFPSLPEFPDVKYATRLWERARTMLHYGMEWSLEHTMTEHDCLKYFFHKPCCSWRATNKAESAEYGRGLRCADASWKPWDLAFKLPCVGLDFMYVKYRMIDEAAYYGEDLQPEDLPEWIQEMAPPTRCTEPDLADPDEDPWVLHTEYPEVDPLLYCTKRPGGHRWAKHLRGIYGPPNDERQVATALDLSSQPVHFLHSPHDPMLNM